MNIELEMPELSDGLLPALTETTPYLTKEIPSGADRLSLKLIGGTVALNQMVRDGDFTDETHTWQSENINASLSIADGVATVTLTRTAWNVYTPALSLYRRTPKQADACYKGHKYIIAISIKSSVGGVVYFGSSSCSMPTISTPAGEWVDAVRVVNCTRDSDLLFSYIGIGGVTGAIGDYFQVKRVAQYDLTQMFGSTIADYVYSLEQATAGSGIAWLKSYGFFTEDYYPYNAGELLSVNTSAHDSYPIDPIDLRGIPKLTDGTMTYDGDTYEASGTVTRRYGIVDLGTLTWTWNNANGWIASVSGIGNIKPMVSNDVPMNGICDKYRIVSKSESASLVSGSATELAIAATWQGTYLYCTNQNVSPSGWLVYEKPAETTETATPYTDPMTVGATESFVDSRTVPMPVGNVSEYKNTVKMQTIQLFMP